MSYLPFFVQGLNAYPAQPEDCPHQTLTFQRLAWLDGLAAASDRNRDACLAGTSLAFAVDHKPTDTRVAIERYAGRAMIRAAEMDGCAVSVILMPSHVFEPDLWPPIENASAPHSYAGRNYDLNDMPDDEHEHLDDPPDHRD